MKVISALRICMTAALCLSLVTSCDRNDPASTDGVVAPLSAVRPRHAISISTVAQFDSAWNNGNFADGTVFFIESGNVLEFASDKTYDEDAANDKSFSIVGEDTTAILRKTDFTQKLFDVTDVAAPDSGSHRIVFDNVKLQGIGSGSTFANFDEYGSIIVTDAVIDLDTHVFQATCDSFVMDNSHLRAHNGSGLNLKSRQNHAFDYDIQNSTFVRKHTVGPAQGPCNFDFSLAPSGSLLFDNNEFKATSASDSLAFLSVRVISADEALEFAFVDNDFGKQAISFGNTCNAATVNIDLAGNNSDLVFCGDGVGAGELIYCLACDENFILNVTATTWSFEDNPLDYDDFGPISNQNACYVETEPDSVFVEFSLAGTDVFGDSRIDASVLFADDNCTTGVTEVAAWWNPETSKWNSAFDVSGFTDGDCYWRGKGVLCDKTVTGTCIRKRFEECGGGGGVKPEWFNYP
jgi:hypothetical protein